VIKPEALIERMEFRFFHTVLEIPVVNFMDTMSKHVS